MTKYVVSGYIGFDNFGDEAIAQVLVNRLKDLNAEKITLISSNPVKTSSLYGVDSVGMLKFFKALLKTDVLISGGGSLLQDLTSLKSLIYYLGVISTALLFGKKVYIFAQGFTPFRTEIGKFLTKQVLKHCHKITVRDLKSQELLSEMGIESELVADPVFGIKIKENNEHKGVGIQLRKFPKLSKDFMNSLADEIVNNFPNDEIKLISLQDSLDFRILETFSHILDSKGVHATILKDLSVADAINEISKLEYLISMRFHSCLVGAKAGVKVLGINYDIKVQNLAKMIGFPIINLDKNVSKRFEKVLITKPSEYKIPDFVFPNLD